jgi:hypothetical protein
MDGKHIRKRLKLMLALLSSVLALSCADDVIGCLQTGGQCLDNVMTLTALLSAGRCCLARSAAAT